MPQPRRPRHPFPKKLSLDDAVRIRSRYSTGTTARELVAEYGVAVASIYAVLRREAHPCVVSLRLHDATYERLVVAARAATRSVADWAAELVARGLD